MVSHALGCEPVPRLRCHKLEYSRSCSEISNPDPPKSRGWQLVSKKLDKLGFHLPVDLSALLPRVGKQLNGMSSRISLLEF